MMKFNVFDPEQAEAEIETILKENKAVVTFDKLIDCADAAVQLSINKETGKVDYANLQAVAPSVFVDAIIELEVTSEMGIIDRYNALLNGGLLREIKSMVLYKEYEAIIDGIIKNYNENRTLSVVIADELIPLIADMKDHFEDFKMYYTEEDKYDLKTNLNELVKNLVSLFSENKTAVMDLINLAVSVNDRK